MNYSAGREISLEEIVFFILFYVIEPIIVYVNDDRNIPWHYIFKCDIDNMK